jgi:preprotein translocase subunit SecG
MTFFIGLLMFVMVLVSVALIFLVLIQLPKKDAGAGVAFGGGATDALFGAGSGNVLTKVTKYAAIAFFGLALLVGTLQSHNSAKNREGNIKKLIEQEAQQLPTTQPAPATAPAAAPVTAPATTPAETPAQK